MKKKTRIRSRRRRPARVVSVSSRRVVRGHGREMRALDYRRKPSCGHWRAENDRACDLGRWSTYARTPADLSAPSIRPNGRDVPISRSVRSLRNTCKTPGNRSPNSRLDASRWGSLPASRKSSLKAHLALVSPRLVCVTSFVVNRPLCTTDVKPFADRLFSSVERDKWRARNDTEMEHTVFGLAVNNVMDLFLFVKFHNPVQGECNSFSTTATPV